MPRSFDGNSYGKTGLSRARQKLFQAIFADLTLVSNLETFVAGRLGFGASMALQCFSATSVSFAVIRLLLTRATSPLMSASSLVIIQVSSATVFLAFSLRLGVGVTCPQ